MHIEKEMLPTEERKTRRVTQQKVRHRQHDKGTHFLPRPLFEVVQHVFRALLEEEFRLQTGAQYER